MSDLGEFVLGPTEPPEEVLSLAALLLADTLGVTAGGTELAAGRIAREGALVLFGPPAGAAPAPMMFDGRGVSAAGAAFAAATQTDNLDAHDGLNPTKGHIGCAVVPALYALGLHRGDLGGRAALTAMVIGYEVAARAAMALHRTVSDYHTSGAWNALGVAALGVRLAGGSGDVLRQALGIAEYHGPRSQMMREIATPTMLHDGSGMGALTGVMAVELAVRGFTGAPAVTVEEDRVADLWADLGRRWTILESYLKPYPICRWAHAALDAGHALTEGLDPSAIDRIEVRSFTQAAALFEGMPADTSQAQYSLKFALATLVLRRRLGVTQITGPALSDPETAALVDRIEVRADPRHSDVFPAKRQADVTVLLRDGRRLRSGDVEAKGGPEGPMTRAEVRAKFDDLARGLGPERGAAIWEAALGLTRPEARFAELARLLTDPPAQTGGAGS